MNVSKKPQFILAITDWQLRHLQLLNCILLLTSSLAILHALLIYYIHKAFTCAGERIPFGSCSALQHKCHNTEVEAVSLTSRSVSNFIYLFDNLFTAS